MLLVLFPCSFFLLSACVVGLLLPACVSVQSGSSFFSLLYSFLAKRTKLSSFLSKNHNDPICLLLTCFFYSELGITVAFFAATSVRWGWGCQWAQDCGLELHSYDHTEGNSCLETTQRLFCCRLTCTDVGKQALDDDALGGTWDGVVRRKEKGKGNEKDPGRER
jgi:hypothetical protein